MHLRRLLTSGFLFFSFFSQATPMYWLATKGNTQLMLIGTVHVGFKSMYPLPKDIEQFLKQSNGLILEADLNAPTPIQPPASTYTAQEVLKPTQQILLDQIAKQLSLSKTHLRSLPPWSAALTIQLKQLENLGYRGEDGVDQYLTRLAQRDSIPILGLETAQFQLDTLASQKKNGQELLVSAIEDWHHNKNNMRCMIKSWRAGDKANFVDLIKKSAMSEQLSEDLALKRNLDWSEKIVSGKLLSSDGGKYLVAVGLIHLIGHDSLIAQLEKKGFTVSQQNQSDPAGCRFL